MEYWTAPKRTFLMLFFFCFAAGLIVGTAATTIALGRLA